MRRKWTAGLAILFSLSTLAVAAQGGTSANGSFTIFHTNDFHGRHLPFQALKSDATSQTDDPGEAGSYHFDRDGEVGGFSRLATVVKEARQRDGKDSVLVLHAGDTFSDDLLGNLTKGEAIIHLMNTVGFDFMALGNHDFDYGPEQTKALQKIAKFPMRGANIIDEGTGKPVLGEPYVVLSRGGVKVALLGIGYTNTPWTASEKATKGLRFEDGIEVARRYVPELRRQADAVIVVSHLGDTGDKLLAREVEGIDLVVGGHSHDHIDPPQKIGNTWIVQALSDAAEYGQVKVSVSDGKVSSVDAAVHTMWADEIKADPEVEKQIAALRAPHKQQLEEVLFTAAAPIPRDYKSESAFDRLLGDALREKTGADVALLPGVGYGITLQAGPVTREALYTLLPHPAKLVTVDLTGAQILKTLEQTATNQKPDDPRNIVGGLLQTSGMGWTVDLTKPIGKRVSEVTIGDKALDPEAVYRVATHTGMLGGIHRYEEIAKGENVQRTDTKVVDVLEQFLRGKQDVRPPQLGAVRLIKAEG